jgi:hypothetical protein
LRVPDAAGQTSQTSLARTGIRILRHLESTRYPARDYLKILWIRDSRILKP